MNGTSRFDVVVVGGGPAGAVCALQLAKRGARVALLYRKDTPRKGVELISARARSLLDQQVSASLASRANLIEVSETVSLWGDDGPQVWNAILNPYGKSIVVERLAFDETLRNQAAACGAEVLPGHEVHRLARVDGHWRVCLRHREESSVLNARWLVVATGRDARDLLGRRPRLRSKGIALTAIMDSRPGAPRHTFNLELGEHGWWYALPRPGGGTFVGYCVSGPACRGISISSKFQIALERTRLMRELVRFDMDTLVVKVRTVGTRGFNQVCGVNWISVGDSAFAPDPLSGLGCEFAIESALQAAEALRSARRQSAMTEYEKYVSEFSECHTQQASNYYSSFDAQPDKLAVS